MGLIKLVCETYSLLNVDRIGRRPLLMIGSLGLTASLLAIGASMQIKIAAATPGVTAASIGVFAGIVGYMAFHALSYGPCAARRRARPRATATPLPPPPGLARDESCRARRITSTPHTRPSTAFHRLTPPYTTSPTLPTLHPLTGSRGSCSPRSSRPTSAARRWASPPWSTAAPPSSWPTLSSPCASGSSGAAPSTCTRPSQASARREEA